MFLLLNSPSIALSLVCDKWASQTVLWWAIRDKKPILIPKDQLSFSFSLVNQVIGNSWHWPKSAQKRERPQQVKSAQITDEERLTSVYRSRSSSIHLWESSQELHELEGDRV
jgi:hypothetical protein